MSENNPDNSNNDNNNNNNRQDEEQRQQNYPEAYSPSAATAAKHRYLEERLIARMRRLQMIGANYDQICETLHISRATLYRYIRKMADQDRVYMQKKFEDVLIVEINWLWNALKETYAICRTIEHSREADVAEKLEAGKLKNEVAIASVKLLREGARTTLGEMDNDTKKKVMMVAGPIPAVGGTVEVPATAVVPLSIEDQIEFETVGGGEEENEQSSRKGRQQQRGRKKKKGKK